MRIGLLLPRSGPASLWRLGCEACAALAVADLEAEGRPVDLVTAHSGPDPASAARAAVILRDLRGADVVVGMQLSHQRLAVERALGGRIPYVYTPLHEGGAFGPATLALGLSDAETLAPTLEWLGRRAGGRRVAFIGSDYVWPRATGATCAATGARLVATALAPIGAEDFGPELDMLRRSGADLLVSALIGEDAVRFHRAFAEAGLPRRMARVALGFEETLLWAVGPAATEGMFAVQPFFADGDAGRREGMLDRYAALHGLRAPSVNGLSLGVYDGVRLAARLAEASDAASAARALDRGRAMALIGEAERPPVILAEADGARFRPRLTA